MKRIKPGWIFAFCMILTGCDSTPVYKDASAPVEKRIKDLLSRMTLEEKAAQLDMLSAPDILLEGKTFREERLVHFIDSMAIGAVHDFYPRTPEFANELQRRAVEKTRLGIPMLFMEEGLHGYSGVGATTFPVSLGNASTWDTTLVYRVGQAIGEGSRANGVHFVLSPNLDLGREPRWGRIEETYGEDVYLNSRMAVNVVKGMQGNSLKDNSSVASEPKHFGIHGIPENGSNTGPAFIGEREARSTHFYIFEKAVREANARGIMAAYHDIDGVPCISNHRLLTGLLRNEWGFDGMVVTDLGAIRRLVNTHFTAKDPKDAITQAINAGLDMQFYDFDYDIFQKAIVDGVNDGSITKKTLDRAVSAVLRIKFELGLFENPYIDESLIHRIIQSGRHKALALEAGRKSIILLKNEGNTLPFSKDVKRIALIGKLADISSIGGYSPRGAKGMTVYEALKKRFGEDVRIDFIQTGISSRFTAISPSALSNHLHPDEKGLYGEYFDHADLSGAPSYTAIDPELSTHWHNLSPAPGIGANHFSIRWTGSITVPTSGIYEFSVTADDYARLYLNNELFIDNWGENAAGKIGKANIISLQGNRPVPIKVEFAELDENASLNIRWRLAEAADDPDYYTYMTRVAAAADAVIVVTGETSQEVGEGKDRQDLNMHTGDMEMLKAVARSGKPVVTVLLNGRPLVFTPVVEASTAILEAWYPGEFGGEAIADVLFGDYNPSGKLTLSIPRYQGQVPVYYSKHPSSPRSYTDGNGEPLYSFGHGLSYSTFEYSNLNIYPENPTVNDKITVSLNVKNTGSADGTETVQLYVRDKIASVATPVKALKGFSQVFLKVGETKTVEMEIIPSEHLWLINLDMKRIVEPGEFDFMIGASSVDIKFTQTISLSE
ncbi:MAG: glycoside hydrolase family 3 C-terminal domain-containing protein [Tannerella sp.]|nr:glycoside hydrolase family 3 C-terminal domain-containing protein [Tannerella sp.]